MQSNIADQKLATSSLVKRKLESDASYQQEKKQRVSQGQDEMKLANQRERLKLERLKLPIKVARKRLLKHLAELRGRSVIIIGETGSGKTTQIPQYIYEAGLYKGGIIACTQPRRVAAVTVAQRVAEEMGTCVGRLVGYNVRFDDCTTAESKIVYMTDGMLLREALLDPKLLRYSVIILDEAHERTVHTDVLFGVVKAAQKQRLTSSSGKPPLQVIVMSATMDVDHFSEYFNKAPVLYIEGRQHQVELFYARQTQSDYIFSSLITVFQIHQMAPARHDILVFLTGQEEIESVVKSIRDISHDLPAECPPMLVYPLYAALPPSQQLKAFAHTPKGHRKVIISTNIAETSVTIHGIKYVVDCGRVKAKCFNASTGLDLLAVQPISKAQSWQRSGRAGREAAGTCYRLYTEDEFESLADNTVPEILRCNLASVVLQLLAMGIKDVVNFDFMDKPSQQSVSTALEQLHWLGAVESVSSQKLTEVGRKLSSFPLSPQLAKVLLTASSFLCLNEVLSIVSMLSIEAVLHTPNSKREEALSARRKFIATEGDHLTLLNVYTAYTTSKASKNWCSENFVNARNMKLVSDVRSQLSDICVQLKLPINSQPCSDTSAIRKCLCCGFFMNAAERVQDGFYVTVTGHKRVQLHPSSVLFHSRPDCVIYNEIVQTNKCYMRDLTVVDADWLFDAAPPTFRSHFRLAARLNTS